MTLCFLDPVALYRVVPMVSGADLTLRVERTPFSSFSQRVSVADNRHAGPLVTTRFWQFLADDEDFNLLAAEGAHSTEFVHELARRCG